MSKTLLTEREVIQKTPISKQFGEVEFCPYIEIVESLDFCEVFTPELYDKMLGALIDYSDSPSYDYKKEDYGLTDVVYFEGEYYVALKENITDPPPCISWKKAPKFNDECCQNLWDKGMCQYLSYLVLRHAVPFIASHITPQGVVKPESDKIAFSPADYKSVSGLQKAIDNLIDLSYRNVAKCICKSECFSDDLKCCINCGCEDCCGRHKVIKSPKRRGNIKVGTNKKYNRYNNFNRWDY